MTKREHLVAGQKAANDALNTGRGPGCAGKTAKLYALAAYHFRRARSMGDFYADPTSGHRYAAQYAKDAADECKRNKDKAGAAAWTRFAKAQRKAIKGSYRSTSRLTGHGPSRRTILRKMPRE